MFDKRTVGFEIVMVANLMRRQIPRNAKQASIQELTQRQRWIIGFLSMHRDKDVFQKDLEEELNIRRSTASGMLRLLEENGFITREPVAYDARLKKLVLTEKARQSQATARAVLEGMEERLIRGLTDADLKEFFRIIDTIKANLE